MVVETVKEKVVPFSFTQVLLQQEMADHFHQILLMMISVRKQIMMIFTALC